MEAGSDMATILIIDKDEDYCDHVSRFFMSLDYSISPANSYAQALAALNEHPVDVVISDIDIPGGSIDALVGEVKSRQPMASIILVHSDARRAQEALGDLSKDVYRVLQKPFYDAELHFQVKRAIESSLDRAAAAGVPVEAAQDENLHSEFIGQSPAIRRIFRVLGRVAKTDASVIILGETGTGKELIAWTLHRDSLRADGPFVKVNCAALPEQLLESELFGYEKGAFTGADKMRVGRFEHANGGTIFLDEVADMSLVTQAKLLRVIQQREFERLGSNVTVKTDVRIVSATNKDLVELMRKGLFREDLFYRLNVICIRLPPSRERGGDISLLLHYFLRRSSSNLKKRIRGFKAESLEMLTKYLWPGNIREMENTLERAVLMAESDMISLEDLDLIFADKGSASWNGDFEESDDDLPEAPARVHLPSKGITLDEAERQLIEQALERCGGSQKKAAALLGVSGRVLNYKIMNMKKASKPNENAAEE
jgi:two-component system, NtrC family, response regulator AtoC